MTDNQSKSASLIGKAAIVTGASREIGAAMAEALAREGAAVLVAHYREPELAEATVARIRSIGGMALPCDCDCSIVSEIRGMVARAVSEFGRLDIFVANAGLTLWAPFLEYTEAAWDTVMSLNLKGSFFGAQAAAQQMVKQGSGGSIVISSSVAGIQAIQYLSAYGISKAGLRHMARTASASTPSASAQRSINATSTTTQTTMLTGAAFPRPAAPPGPQTWPAPCSSSSRTRTSRARPSWWTAGGRFIRRRRDWTL